MLNCTQEHSGTNQLKKDDIDHDSDCSNELVSVDTGRGSSLAFSDSDKCFNSPDYFINDTPLSTEIVLQHSKKMVERGTSPITVHRIAHASTSPVIFEPPDLPIIIVTEDCNTTPVFDKFTVPKITADKGVSPIKSFLKIDRPASDSCFKPKTSKEIATSPIRFSNKKNNDQECYGCGKSLQEKVCLELNNSNNLVDDNSDDGEIEMILNTMRMNHELITPIPSTPKSRTAEKSLSKACNNINKTHHDNPQFECQDAAKIREDNKILHSNIADLAKEIISIKSLLMKHMFNEKDFSDTNLDMNQVFSERDLSTSDEPRDCAVANEIDVMNDINDNCSTGDESDIVRLDGDNSDIVHLEDLMSMPDEHLTINEINNYEKEILHVDTENTTLNSAQNLQFEEEHQQELNSTEENLDEPLEGPIIKNQDSVSDKRKKMVNTRKLTRLEKLRKKLVPKGKIRKIDTPPLKKLSLKPKQLPLKRKIKNSDSSASLNNKDVYDKAVKIMAALKSKQPKKDKCDVIDKNNKNINVVSDTVPLSDKSECEVIAEAADNRVGGNIHSRRRQSTSSTTSVKSSITTRSRTKHIVQDVNLQKEMLKPGDNNNNLKENDVTIPNDKKSTPQDSRKRLKRSSVDKPEVENKRILRSSSSNIKTDSPVKENIEARVAPAKDVETNDQKTQSLTKNQGETEKMDDHGIVNYSDLNMFTDETVPVTEPQTLKKMENDKATSDIQNPHESLLCRMIDNHSISSNRVKNSSKMSGMFIIIYKYMVLG